jgi:hypothetical protein
MFTIVYLFFIDFNYFSTYNPFTPSVFVTFFIPSIIPLYCSEDDDCKVKRARIKSSGSKK